MRWTQEQYEDYIIRSRLNNKAQVERRLDENPGSFFLSSGTPDPEPPASPEPESVLQGKIQRWAKEKGYPIQSNRQTKKAKGLLTPGWPDICLILYNRVVFIELKSAKGYLRKEQKDLRIQFLHLGHEIHEVRTFKRFLEIANAL